MDYQLNQQLFGQSSHLTDQTNQISHHYKKSSFKTFHYHPYLFHLKSNLMNFKRCLLFVFIIMVHLLTVHALSNEHFSDDLNNPNQNLNQHFNQNNLNDKFIKNLNEDDKLKEKSFLNEFAIELDTSSCPTDQLSCKEHLDKKANDLADKHGFINTGQVSLMILNLMIILSIKIRYLCLSIHIYLDYD